MIVVQAMAGEGSRFRAVGADLCKPLISVRGKPLFLWALESLPVGEATLVVLVASREAAAYRPSSFAEAAWPDTAFATVVLPHPTRGQADTILQALEELGLEDSTEPLVVFNCDTHVTPPFDASPLREADGVLQLFRARGDHWSFAEVRDERVVRVAEKERIAEWCSTGLYGFGSVSRFVELAWEAHDETPPDRELFVAPLYEKLLRQGGLVLPSYAPEVVPLGTPEELSAFEPGWEADARRFLTGPRAA